MQWINNILDKRFTRAESRWKIKQFEYSLTDAPVCINSGVTVVGASLDESVKIGCRVSADPSKVSFEWTFSNSGERFEVPSGHFTTIQDFNSDHMYFDTEENENNGKRLKNLNWFI